jgi:hypothetical protein
MTESNAQSGVPAVAHQLGNEKQRRCCTYHRRPGSAVFHPDVMKAAQALIGVAWRKDKDRIPGAVDRVLDELKKHPQNSTLCVKTANK